MKQLPSPDVYEKEYAYMPWGKLMAKVLQLVNRQAPKHGAVLDLMCGPGYLLGKIHQQRKDLHLTGVDNDSRYIAYGRKKYGFATFIEADSRLWNGDQLYDVIVCTGGLHHLPYRYHRQFIVKLSTLLRPGGQCLLADPYVDMYRNEKQRRRAAAKLGYEYIKAVIEKGATDDIISVCLDIMSNDILPNGEYKTYIKRIEKMAKLTFSKVVVQKIWPNYSSQFGDYLLILKKV